jgi:type I restriction enzyme S subunit
MELKRGFKQTDIGVLPDDWDVSTVGAEFSVKLGKMLDAANNFGVAKPYVGNKAVQWDRIDVTDLPTVPMSPSDLRRFRLEKGDLLVCEGGEVGRAAIWDAPIAECYYQKAIHRLRPLGDYNAKLMVAVLRRWASTGLFANYVTQTSIAHLPRDKFIHVPIPRPPEAEQRAIAQALSDVDALLDGLDRLIAKKRDLKQAAMQQLLTGRTRLPGFSEEWTAKRLGEISEIAMGRTPPRLNQAFWGRGFKWLSIADLHTKVVSESKEEITPLAASTMTIIPKGTLLMSFKLSIGRLCFAGCDLFTNEAICSFNNLQANAEFLYYVLGRTDFSLYGKQAVKGYTLNKDSLKLVEVRMPSLPEQAAIASVLSDMDADLTALDSRRNKVRLLKQAVMQQLLTGRTRLVDTQGAIA